MEAICGKLSPVSLQLLHMPLCPLFVGIYETLPSYFRSVFQTALHLAISPPLQPCVVHMMVVMISMMKELLQETSESMGKH